MFRMNKNAPVWLVFSALLLLPVGRAVELPTLFMSIAGMTLIWRQRGVLFQDPGQKLLGWLFLCIWVPIVISLADTVNFDRTGSTILAFLRLYLAGVFVTWTFADEQRRRLLLRLGGALIAFWVLDALLQAVRGTDLFGFRYVSSRLNGVYGERHLDLGVALPTLAPLLLIALRRNPWLLSIAAMLTGIVVILAGSRGGWVSYALVCLLLLINEIRHLRLRWLWGALIATLLIGILAIFTNINPEARQRFQTTLGLFSGDRQLVDHALSGRLQIWETSWQMFRAHPITGVGTNGFRHAYPDYAPPGDIFVDPKAHTGAFYAHQLLVQVGTDSGLIGLAGLLLFYGVWLRSWRGADSTRKEAALPFALAALAWLFPLNTHASFYSSQWSQLIWLLLALYCAALADRRPKIRPPGDSPE
jgi:O-antigen ligase